MRQAKNPYRQKDHGGFDGEWLPHKGASGWWYVTGHLRETGRPDSLYSYQFTVVNAVFGKLSAYVLQLALTDLRKGEHRFKQQPNLTGRGVRVDRREVVFGSIARLRREGDLTRFEADTDRFGMSLSLGSGKGAFWHGDGGVLVMGVPGDPRQRTVYYSYPNMPTVGEITIDGRRLAVSGKSWMDRQWGPFRMLDLRTHWEWFSLRFHDDEEVMLFAFPQDPYRDGTYIDKAGTARRIRDYSYEPMELIDVNGLTYSRGWRLTLPGIREERYEIRPLSEHQNNLGYFELLAGIYDPQGVERGLCFVELLPGARTPKSRVRWSKAFTLFRKA